MLNTDVVIFASVGGGSLQLVFHISHTAVLNVHFAEIYSQKIGFPEILKTTRKKTKSPETNVT